MTSLFFLPEQGMPGFEMLARASSIMVETGLSKPRYLFLGPAHTTHPWRFSNYYPPSEYGWLQHVYSEAVRVEIGIREPGTGKQLCAFRCAPHWPLIRGSAELFLHPTRDLVAMRVENEGAFLASLATMGLAPKALVLEPRALRSGDALTMVGHNIIDDQAAEGTLPLSMSGVLKTVTGDRSFIAAPAGVDVPMGMCGGPILNEEGQCVGMVEGKVVAKKIAPNTPDPFQSLVGCAVGIPGKVLADFVTRLVTEKRL